MTSRSVDVARFDDLEHTVEDTVGHSTGSLLKKKSSSEKLSIRRRAIEYMWWKDRLNRSQMVVVPKSACNNVFQSFQDELGHWHIKSTAKLVADQF